MPADFVFRVRPRLKFHLRNLSNLRINPDGLRIPKTFGNISADFLGIKPGYFNYPGTFGGEICAFCVICG
jgi:hypothetical protein